MSTERVIEIRGGEATLVRREFLRTVSTEELITKLTDSRPMQTPIMPPETILYRQWDYQGTLHRLFVLQWPPRVAVLNYRSNQIQRAPVKPYTVGLPWTQWYVKCVQSVAMRLWVTATREAATLASPIYRIPLPNQKFPRNFCLGEVNARSGEPLEKQIPGLISDTMASIWNDDLSSSWNRIGLALSEDAQETALAAYNAAVSRAGDTPADSPQHERRMERIVECALTAQETRGIPVWAAKHADGLSYWDAFRAESLRITQTGYDNFAKVVETLGQGGVG
jgi:hypothetical protein